MALHYITGDPVKKNGVYVKNARGETLYDTSFEGLSAIYGVTPQQIAAANGFKWNAADIYAWLKTHGGIETTKGVWSFASGMSIEIPVSQDKIISPVPTDRAAQIQPAGPSTPPVTTTPGGSVTPTQAGVGDNMTMIVVAAVVLGLLFMMKTGKKGRKTSKRRTSRRRR